MSERTREVRARMHAALAEPVRLAIVDELGFGDASPGELGAATGLATNLLAHHLRVLEEAGVVRRVRSEADRRRSYVQLRWDDDTVAALVSTPVVGVAVPRVVFACTRNSARSQLAAATWARVSAVPAASAGTHPVDRVHPGAVAAGRRHDLPVGATGTHLLADVVRPGDLLVAVCDNAYEELAALAVGADPAPGARRRITGSRDWLHWAVPDPVRVGTEEAFESAYTDLRHRILRLAAALVPA